MADEEHPQIYLLTPPEIELSSFPSRLDEVLESHDIACIRLALSSKNEDDIARAADAVRDVSHAHDVALVIDSHVALAERLGLDGVHLNDGARSIRKVRKQLGVDAIIGAFCGTSKHDGMNAGEAGADYISFGPVGETALGDGQTADFELFEWWSQMIELPVVAEGAIDEDVVARLAPVVDFFAIGDEIWREDDAVAALTRLTARM